MKYELSKNYPAIYYSAIAAGIRYLQKNENISSMVLGVSGGIDSAITALLAREVCEALPNRKIKLIGVSIPIHSNEKEEIERSIIVGDAFCHDFNKINLSNECSTIVNSTFNGVYDNSVKEKVRIGNIKARLRMIYLYNLASANNGFVLSTDNLTEYYLGFWTLHGDVGDFGFIQNLWKTEIYNMAKWYASSDDTEESNALRSCIYAKPTDGLGVSNSDIDQLLPSMAHTEEWTLAYEVIDKILISYLNGDMNMQLSKDEEIVIGRYLNSQFKRNNPVNISRDMLI